MAVLGTEAIAIEHVGSTAVPGLAAKPIINISIVLSESNQMPCLIKRLATLEYGHLGDLGIEGREAFMHPPHLPRHNLYACPQGSLGLRNHLAFRDYLRSNPDSVQAYGRLKRELAAKYANDIDAYTDAKTDFIVDVLSTLGLEPKELESIDRANRLKRSDKSDEPVQGVRPG